MNEIESRIQQEWEEETGEASTLEQLKGECGGEFGCAVLVLDDDETRELKCPWCGQEWVWSPSGWAKA